MVTSMTTNGAINTITNETIKQYNTNGFGSGASGFIVIIIALIFIGLAGYIIKRNQKKSEDLQEKLLKLFEESVNNNNKEMKELNTNMIDEIKNITLVIKESMETMNINTTKSNEMIYSIIESGNDRIVDIINSEKQITLSDFEKQCKVLMELSLLRVYESLTSRLEKNDLVKLKCDLIGTEIQCHKDSEIFSIIRKFALECKSDMKGLNYSNDTIKTKVFDKYSEYLNDLNEKMCGVFDVNEGYSKELVGRTLRNTLFSTLNTINDLSFDKL